MMIAILIYLASVAENIQIPMIVFAILALCISAVCFVLHFNPHDYGSGFEKETLSLFKTYYPRFLKWGMIMLIVGCLLPDKKTVALMYVVPKLVNSSLVQKDMPDLYELGVKALKEQIAPKKTDAEIRQHNKENN